MVNVTAVPKRLEDMIGQPENKDILHRLFAEVVVDAVGLGFGKDVRELRVERMGGREVSAERLLDYDTPPRRLFPIPLMKSHSP